MYTEYDVEELEDELKTMNAKAQAALNRGEMVLYDNYISEIRHMEKRLDDMLYEIEAERKCMEEQCE